MKLSIAGAPPPRLTCEIAGWPERCPHAGCPNRLRGGRLCARTVEDLFDAGDRGESWGLERTRANVGWALSLDQSRIYQIERRALAKMRRALRPEAA